MTPGPGQYQHKTSVGTSGPKFSMVGNRPESSSAKRDMPGPGQYNIHLNDRAKTPSYRIGSAKRDGSSKFNELNPGPGQYTPYNNTSIRPKSPVWSMGTGTRKPMSHTENGPGPGNYGSITSVGNGPKVKSFIY